MRYFIALEIPSTDRHQIEQLQQKIHELVPRARLTDTHKLHLTIAFIGDQPDTIKETLIELIAKAAKEIPSFTVTPAYIDGFPNLHHAQVLWLGVKGEIDKLMIIRERIKDGLEQLQLPVDERRYTPHITLAKLSNFSINPEQEQAFQQIVLEPFTSIQINSIKLFESVAEGGFHQHNTLAEIKLG